MLGKLFGFRKDDSSKTAPTQAPPAPAGGTTAVARTQEPSLLTQLTAGQPLESVNSEILHQLVKHSDKLDKKTNRLVRERLQTMREQEKQHQLLRDKQEKLCMRLETLARLQHHPLFDSELAHLQQQWQAMTDPAADLSARVEHALQRCRQTQADIAALKQQQAAAEQEAVAQAEQQRLLEEQRAAEQAALAEQQGEAEREQQQKAQEKKQQSQADREKHDQRQKDIRQTLQQQLQQLEASIEAADSKKARELHDKARDNLKQLDNRYVHEFDGKLHLLSGQLRELQDWQSFAAMPKLEELLAAMVKLVDTELPPLQKADAVRELQEQWRATKPPASKQARALWDRFKQASDKAWEPCAAHFEKEKQQRAFNLQQRQAICDALEQFFAVQDWSKADWKAVARILEKAKQEFHDFHPVERGEEKAIRTRFDAALGAVNGKLLEEQQANEDKKRQLVEAARSIATMADLDKAVERVRQLQEQWKAIGLTRRHEDQKLWQQLQEQTTLIYDKRRASQQQQRQAEHDMADQARAVCTQIAALATLPDTELSQSSAEFDRLQAEFKTMTATLHEKQQQILKKAFYAACDSYRQQLTGISQRQHGLQLQELARRAALCAQAEAEPSGNHLSALQDAWQQVGLPAEWERAIDARRQQALAAAQQEQRPDYAANEERLRELCIALEILLDLDTPEEDRPRRREYQMRRLQQGLGQASGNRREQVESLLVQWYCASPAANATQALLQARFDAAQARAGK